MLGDNSVIDGSYRGLRHILLRKSGDMPNNGWDAMVRVHSVWQFDRAFWPVHIREARRFDDRLNEGPTLIVVTYLL
jgi:hypothetical protein